MIHSRRSLLTTVGAALPFGLAHHAHAASARAAIDPGPAPTVHFQDFEAAVAAAFRESDDPAHPEPAARRVAVGDSDLFRSGLQGCRNAEAFAGFPAGRLRIVRAGSSPGPARSGVRLYESWVEVVRVDDGAAHEPGRPVDFRTIAPAPVLA